MVHAYDMMFIEMPWVSEASESDARRSASASKVKAADLKSATSTMEVTSKTYDILDKHVMNCINKRMIYFMILICIVLYYMIRKDILFNSILFYSIILYYIVQLFQEFAASAMQFRSLILAAAGCTAATCVLSLISIKPSPFTASNSWLQVLAATQHAWSLLLVAFHVVRCSFL